MYKVYNEELMQDIHNTAFYLDARGLTMQDLLDNAEITEVDRFDDNWTYPLADAEERVWNTAVKILAKLTGEDVNEYIGDTV